MCESRGSQILVIPSFEGFTRCKDLNEKRRACSTARKLRWTIVKIGKDWMRKCNISSKVKDHNHECQISVKCHNFPLHEKQFGFSWGIRWFHGGFGGSWSSGLCTMQCPQARAFLKKWALSLWPWGPRYFGDTPALGHYPTEKEQ
jgi:hypothetical protein